jgi:branched-chain amino acid transport system ATP-binding protein
VAIVRGVSLNVPRGSIVAVIGPNGAGKSTLLRGIAGLANVTQGAVYVDGKPATGLPAQRLVGIGVSFIPQEHTVFAEMSVGENIRLGGWIRRRDRRWLKRRMSDVAELFPALATKLESRAGTLSGGQQKMVELARGLIPEPKILLLDEPTAGLSPQLAAEVYKQIGRLSKEHSISVLLVDQNVHEALALADHVYALTMGRNDVDGTAADVIQALDEIVRGWLRRQEEGLVP